MKISKPQDSAAERIEFGIELETVIPTSADISVGGYHTGHSVVTGLETGTGRVLVAPKFGASYWRADSDSSISCPRGYKRCEFVSPILHGELGLTVLREFIEFTNRIGAKVNASCGLHITVGIRSVIGTAETQAVAEYVRKLAHIAQHNAWAIYAQTGTDRHLNEYSAAWPTEVEQLVRQMTRSDATHAARLATRCGRKRIVNFSKAFIGDHSAIEFRAFAGTLSEAHVMHHLATAFGLMRRAATVQTLGRFDRKATKKHSHVTNAVEAVRRMWRILGWVDSVSGRDCALGLFGPLHAEFGSYRKAALEMAETFEQRFPAANL